MAENKSNALAAFASRTSSGNHRYIVFGLAPTSEQYNRGDHGANRFLPHVASHELFHIYGFQHPRSDLRKGEEPNNRSLAQLRQDVAPDLLDGRGYGTYDPKTGGRIITYSFAASPSLVPHGIEANNNSYKQDPTGVYVENMMNCADCDDEKRSATHKAIREVMTDTFALHSSLFNVQFVEATDPAKADLLIYSADIPTRAVTSYEIQRGRSGAYNKDAIIMSYTNAVSNIHPTSAVGEIFVAQQVYGLPPEKKDGELFYDRDLIERSGVLWSHEPMRIRLTESPMLGAVKVDMGAGLYQPAITGELGEGEKKLPLRHHIGIGSILREIDATGTAITLDVTTANDAEVKVGNGSTIQLKGNKTHVTLGPGEDVITYLKGSEHVISGLGEEDSIRAQTAKKVAVVQTESGTRLTLVSEDASEALGWMLVENTTPEEVLKRVRDLVQIDPSEIKERAIEIKANDGDNFLRSVTTKYASYNYNTDVMVSSVLMSGKGVSNTGGGRLIIKMTAEEYESLKIKPANINGDYEATFTSGNKTHTMWLKKETAFAVKREDGKFKRLINLDDAMQELAMSTILQQGLKDGSLFGALKERLPLLKTNKRELA